MPACLVQLLLLKSGIESNPGPLPGLKYPCSVCKIDITKRNTSVLCSKCKNWCHFHRTIKSKNCSLLKSTEDYDRGYTCPTCSPPPPPPIPTASQLNTLSSPSHHMKIGQININGIQKKSTELTKWLIDNDIKVCVIQETKLQDKSTVPSFPQFTFHRKDRQNKAGGGLAILVHDSLNFIPLPDPPSDPHIEHQAIKIQDLTIVNIYIPPVSSCSTPNYVPDLTRFLPDNDALVLGDINAHDPAPPGIPVFLMITGAV